MSCRNNKTITVRPQPDRVGHISNPPCSLRPLAMPTPSPPRPGSAGLYSQQNRNPQGQPAIGRASSGFMLDANPPAMQQMPALGPSFTFSSPQPQLSHQFPVQQLAPGVLSAYPSPTPTLFGSSTSSLSADLRVSGSAVPGLTAGGPLPLHAAFGSAVFAVPNLTLPPSLTNNYAAGGGLTTQGPNLARRRSIATTDNLTPPVPRPLPTLPPLPPDQISAKLIRSFFKYCADPCYPLLHKGKFSRMKRLSPIVLSALLLVSLRMSPNLDLDAATKEAYQVSLFSRIRTELLYALQQSSSDDFESVIRMVHSLLLLMTWAEARGLYECDRGLQQLCGRIVVDVLFNKHLSKASTPWDVTLSAVLGVASPEEACMVDLGATDIAILRDAWIEHWELQDALWYLLSHVTMARVRRRDIGDPFGRNLYSRIVEHLFSPPLQPVWEGSFEESFDPRFCAHRSIRMAPFVRWIDELDQPGDLGNRASQIAQFQNLRVASRGLSPLLFFKMRLMTDEFLALCLKNGLRSPAELLNPLPDTQINDADLVACLKLRETAESVMALMWNMSTPAIRDTWESCDVRGFVGIYERLFESQDTGAYIASFAPQFQMLRMELRTSIGIFLCSGQPDVGAGMNQKNPREQQPVLDLDTLDLSDDYSAWGDNFRGIVPDLLVATRFVEQFLEIYEYPSSRLVPCFLGITLFHVCCFRRLTRMAGQMEQGAVEAMETVNHNLGICLSLLQKWAVEQPNSFACSVFLLVKQLLEQGKATAAQLVEAEARSDIVGGGVMSSGEGTGEIAGEAKVLKELLLSGVVLASGR